MNYNTGEVIAFDILKKDKINAAREIAEGNSELEKLLLLCFDNDIRTVSCYHNDEFVTKKRKFIEITRFCFFQIRNQNNGLRIINCGSVLGITYYVVLFFCCVRLTPIIAKFIF